MVGTLALTKGRSSAPGLVRPIRQACAVLLRTDVTPHLRWTPSELNPGDAPSRGHRIEKGGGVDKAEIELVLSRLEEQS
eukprot:2869170-Karenia_brevis.AAC.1